MTGPRWSASIEGRRPPRKPVVLVAMDGSQESIRAADWAIDMGRGIGASVVLVHAVHLSLTSYGPANPRWLKDGLRHEAMDRAEPIMSRAQAAGVNVVFAAEEGVPATVITRAARRWQAQAIVVGASKQGFWHRFFGDHTVEKVTREAECPVIVLETR